MNDFVGFVSRKLSDSAEVGVKVRWEKRLKSHAKKSEYLGGAVLDYLERNVAANLSDVIEFIESLADSKMVKNATTESQQEWNQQMNFEMTWLLDALRDEKPS